MLVARQGFSGFEGRVISPIFPGLDFFSGLLVLGDSGDSVAIDPVAPSDEQPHRLRAPADRIGARRQRTKNVRRIDHAEKGDQGPECPLSDPVDRLGRPREDDDSSNEKGKLDGQRRRK